MKKSFKIIAGLAFAGTVLFSSCNKTNDEVTPVDTSKPVATVEFSDSKTGSLTADVVVSTSGDSAYIALGVNTTTLNSTRIYLVRSEDNGITAPMVLIKDLVGKKYDGTGDNYDFDAKGAYYEIPGKLVGNDVNGGSKFKLNIPLALRKGVTSAKSDVYTLWITNGAGDVINPGKNRVLGNAVITFKYTNSSLINNYETTLGNHKNDLSSLFATVDGTSYRRDTADALDSRESTVDFAYVNPGLGSAAEYVFGSLVDPVVGNQNTIDWKFFDLSTFTTKNDTKFAKTTLTKAQFDAIDDESKLIDNIPSTLTATNVTYPANSAPTNVVFAFKTVNNKKGLVLVKTATGTFNTSGETSLQVKVQR